MIVSASRRTDIPAFYADWFAARLRAGEVMVRNPFNPSQIRRVSLAPNDVDAAVFWTRNFTPLEKHASLLAEWGAPYVVQVTLNAYPRSLESAVPKRAAAVAMIERLARSIGPERVIWRYDPILLCSDMEADDHKRAFAALARDLSGCTRRCMISFADFYKKTERNLRKVPGLTWRSPAHDEQRSLVRFMAENAAEHGIALQTCCEELDFTPDGAAPGACIDGGLLHSLFGIQTGKAKGQRDHCGCAQSADIGVYDSCAHGCAYCYAVSSHEKAAKTAAAANPESPFLGD